MKSEEKAQELIDKPSQEVNKKLLEKYYPNYSGNLTDEKLVNMYLRENKL